MSSTNSRRHRHGSANRAHETPSSSSASSCDSSFSDDEEARIGSTTRAGGKQWTMHSMVSLSSSGVRKIRLADFSPETEQGSRREDQGLQLYSSR
mgnify:FL=1|jgi:hypothetical protein